MAQLAATNLRVLKRDVGYGYVVIGYDDPNTGTKKGAVYVPGQQYSQPYTLDITGRTAVVKGGMDVIIALTNGITEARSETFSVPAAANSNGLTARQHLEAAMGVPFPEGTVVGKVSVDPQRTVQADGSLA